MALTPSTMLALGTRAPDFALPDTEGRTVRLEDYADRAVLVVMFICNHCPYVKHVADELARLGRDYDGSAVGIVAINSNDVEAYPDDSPEQMQAERAARGYTFPYLYDATQQVAHAYTAACTPDFFVFDAERRLAYRGQLDPTRPRRIASGVYDNSNTPDGRDLRAAIDALLEGRRPNEHQTPSIGCNIKWRPGNAPAWFG